MEAKKISFGFMKTKKVEKAPVEEKKEFIDCVEEQSIKVVGGEIVQETAPLVIPMKPNTLVTAERLKKIAEEVESAMEEPDPGEKLQSPVTSDEKPTKAETLDQMAVRELLEDAKKEKKVNTSELTLPVPSKPVMDGQKESTLEDYEAVPIQDFGMAMLRGMGWKPNKDQSKYKQPQLRPKGLGLGADKVIKDNQKKKSSKDKEEELVIIKNSYVKITNGKHSGFYGKVVSLDEDNGRVMVEITVKKETVSMSEFMMQPVTKAEFDKESKVINIESYEEYKKKEKISEKSSKHDSSKVNDREASSSTKSYKDYNKERNREENHKSKRDYDNSSNGRSRDRERRRDSSSSEDRSKQRMKKEKKRYSSNDSLSSLSDRERRKKHKSKKRHSSSDSESSPSPRRDRRKKTPEGKRDIDKKRKGKKKKRDRDRSPNYKKYRK